MMEDNLFYRDEGEKKEIQLEYRRDKARQFRWKAKKTPFIRRRFHLPNYRPDEASAKKAWRENANRISAQWVERLKPVSHQLHTEDLVVSPRHKPDYLTKKKKKSFCL